MKNNVRILWMIRGRAFIPSTARSMAPAHCAYILARQCSLLNMTGHRPRARTNPDPKPKLAL